MPVPSPVSPMLAVPGDVPEGDGWAYEWKWDGVRAAVGVGDGGIRVQSRALRDITETYPELHTFPALTRHRLVLDGELVALDELGRPDFGELQRRMHVQRPSGRLLRDVPVHYYVFDLLVVDGEPLFDLSYDKRRERLLSLDLSPPSCVRAPEHYTHVSGADLLQVAAEHGLEGIVAKRRDSTYRPGARSRSWIKTALRITQEVVIGGWVPGEGRRAATLGALLLGAYDESGDLTYVGHVGTGFSDAALREMLDRLRSRERPSSPFSTPVPRDRARHARWVEPDLVGEVEHRQWTGDQRLRHPSWRGLRPEKEPHDVVVPV